MAEDAAVAAPAADPPPGERGNLPREGLDTIQQDAFSDAFADLDKIVGPDPDPATRVPDPKPPAKREPQPKGGDGKFVKKDDTKGKPAEKQPGPPKEAPKDAPKDTPKAPDESIEKMAPPELRKAYETLRQKHAALEEEHRKAASSPKPPAPAEDPEKKDLSERLTAREKRLAELEEEMRYTNFEKSAEYKEKFEAPFINAWKAGQERASKLKILEQVDEMQNVTSQARKGTAEDFDHLMAIADDDEAAEWATAQFGAKAPMMLFHRERVQEANNARGAAIADYRKNGAEREAARKTLIDNHVKNVRDTYEKSINDATEKYPQWFKVPDDGDPKAKALLEAGNRLADRAMGKPDLPGEKPLSPQQRIHLQAAMRNGFGAFKRMAYDLGKANSRIAELEQKLSEYEASLPTPGEGKGGPAPGAAGGAAAEPDSAEGAFDQAFGTGR